MIFGKLRIGQKLVLALVITLVLAFLAAGLLILRVAERHGSAMADEFSGTINAQVLGVVESFAKELEITSDRLLGAVKLGYPGAFRRDENGRIRVGERDAPALYNGTVLVNSESAYLDRFLSEAKTVATLFVRDGDDFVRVTTSLKKEDGSRAVGTLLDRSHPAYT